jgi:RluA family pseudouridine synthase
MVMSMVVAPLRALAMIGCMLSRSVGEADAGQRLDRYLRKALKATPLSAIFRHLRSGGIRVDGKKAKPELRLVAGMEITFALPDADLAGLTGLGEPSGRAAAERRANPSREPQPRGSSARAIRAPVELHRDQDVLIVDKPAGKASQPGTGLDGADLCTWLDATESALRTPVFAPAPAHRIDRGTSGIVAIGLSPIGLRELAAAFREGTAEKVYLAVVHGVPRPASGSIDAPLETIDHPKKDGPKVRVSQRGQDAGTDYETIAVRADRALLRVTIRTGRMHQIRAHLAHLGHPIVGDVRYGSSVRMGHAFLLHAHQLTVPHPRTGERLSVRCEPPAAFRL